MRVIPSGLARSAAVLFLGGLGACVSAMPASTPYYEAVVPGLKQLPDAEKLRAIDSLQAETVADASGPRVTVRANFYNESGSRRVEAWVRAGDDAYVLVGHIDAAGRMNVVFPHSPTDDGFVQGGHTYRIPPFFGGFADEYRWRRADNYARLSAFSRRTDSYDAGTGYVFVIASWHPMHFDRVADGSRWSSYEISDDEYLSDPRTAVDELATALAGDEHAAYSVSYAKYYTTNNAMYAANYSDRCSFAAQDNTSLGYAYGLFGYRGLVSTVGLMGGGYNWTYYNTGLITPIYAYRSFYDAATGCTYYEPFLAPYYFYTPPTKPPVQPVLPLPKQPRPLTPPNSPRPPKSFDAPKLEPGTNNQRGRPQIIAEQQATDAHGSATDYRRRGLIIDDPVSPQPGQMRATPGTTRPSIEQMIGRRREAPEVRGRPGASEYMTGGTTYQPRFEAPRAAQPRFEAPSGSPRMTAPRAVPAAPRVSTPPHVESIHSAPPPPPPSSSSGSSSSGSGGHKTP